MKNLIPTLICLLSAIPCAAEIIIVDDDWPYDFNNIQAAIDYSSDGDFIYVLPGTYTGTGNRDIDFLGKAITVRGATGDPNDSILNCQGSEATPHRGFKFVSGENANSVLDGITITNGYGLDENISGFMRSSGGAIYCKSSSPSIKNCIISNNSATYFGGGICNYDSNPTLSNCAVSSNSAGSLGGGVYDYNSSPTIRDCTVNNNSAGAGGGINNYHYSSPNISNCVISNNSASSSGGGIYNSPHSDAHITNCIISNNTAEYYGGGIYNNHSSPVISICAISGNSAHEGGGIYNYYSSPNISNCTFSNNSAIDHGGGIYDYFYSHSSITNCTISNNSSGYLGGGVVGSSNSMAIVNNCIIWGNQPSQIGGNTTIKYSDIQGGYTGVGNIDADPCFADPDANDFHLTGVSPCIDSGDPNYVPVPDETDIDGDPRVIIRIDMGADEIYSSTSALLVIIPGTLGFEAQGLSSAPQPQYVSIRNYGVGVLNWQIPEPNDCNWLNVFPTSGQVNAGESNDVEITVNPNMAGYGIHSCQLQVTAPDAQNSPQVLTVNLEVLGPQIGINNDYFYFTAYGKSDTSVAGQELVITNTGFDTLNWHIEISDCNWLNVFPTSGQVNTGESNDVEITVNPNIAGYGIHSCQLQVTAPDAENSPQTVTVNLEVLGPEIGLSQTDYFFTTYQSSDGEVDSQELMITNTGYDTINWQIVVPNDCNWLDIEPLQGQCTSETDVAVLTVDPEGLAKGLYTCEVLVSDVNANNSPVSIVVTLYIPRYLYVPTDYTTIQEAINAALTGDIIVVQPGTYTGDGNRDIDFFGKAITVRSTDPNDPNIVAATIIDCNGTWAEPHRGFYFNNGEDGNSVLDGFTITNGYAFTSWGGFGGGIYCNGSSPTITNCTISGNSAEYGGGIFIYDSSPTVTNCTFSGNAADRGGAMYNAAGTSITANCILWGNTATEGAELYLAGKPGLPVPSGFVTAVTVSYCDVEGGAGGVYVGDDATLNWGHGNIDFDPCFVDPGYWADANDPNIVVEPNDPNAVWINGDYHLKSEGWRWDTPRQVWTWDDVTSRCIDAGNPGCPLGEELLSVPVPYDPNNKWGENLRINMGAYGGTAEASMPPYDWALLANLTNDGKVDSNDLAAFVNYWLDSGECIPSDLNRNQFVDFADFALLGQDWFLETSWYTDPCVPDDMVYIPDGEFEMGDHFAEGDSEELPVHAVLLDASFMSKFEITNSQYCDYLNSAYPGQIKVVSGVVYASSDDPCDYPYCDTHGRDTDSQIDYNDVSGTFSVRTKGEPPRDMNDDPMVEVSWYGSVAYCNWRSSEEGYEACYNLSTWDCNFSKHGYRLPTEGEWEYAARGGLSGKRFPWADPNITHSQANYKANPGVYSYDVSPTSGYHPDYNDVVPYTAPVDSFAANGYGLYDMAGNVWEWCNDWYSSTYYSSSPYDNPTGPVSGTYRVLRGGCWYFSAFDCRVAFRSYYFFPDVRGSSLGFRIVLDLN